MLGRFLPQSDFGAIHLKHTRIASGSRTRPRDGMAWEKSHLHQPPGIVLGEFNAIQNARLALLERSQIAARDQGDLLLETQLHPGLSILLCETEFKG